MRVAGIPLGVGNSVLPPVLPTGIYLFNGANGATTDTNSATNPIGSITFFNDAVISTANAYEGTASLRLNSGTSGFVGYSPTAADYNNVVTARDFYFSIAFNVDGNDSSERGLMYCDNTFGVILFRAYVQNGQVKCYINQVNGVNYTVTVPNLTVSANTWYKLEISRKFVTSEFKVKVGSDEVTQILTADFANPINRVDMGAYWSGSSFIGYLDRFIYQMDSVAPY